MYKIRGKKRRKYHSIMVYLATDGTPLDYIGPMVGRRNDTRVFKYKVPPFFKRHRKWEIICGDGAFESCCHCAVPFDKVSLAEGNPRSKRRFNKLFSEVRSRIERFFGYLNRHALMRARTGLRPRMCALLWRLVWNMVTLASIARKDAPCGVLLRTDLSDHESEDDELCDCGARWGPGLEAAVDLRSAGGGIKV
jgi:hypothetical protein